MASSTWENILAAQRAGRVAGDFTELGNAWGIVPPEEKRRREFLLSQQALQRQQELSDYSMKRKDALTDEDRKRMEGFEDFKKEQQLKALYALPQIQNDLSVLPERNAEGIPTGKMIVNDIPVKTKMSDEELNNMSIEDAAELNLGGTQLPDGGVQKETTLRELQHQMDLEKINSRSRLGGISGSSRPLTSGQRSELLIDATKAGLNIEDYTDDSGNIDFDALSINVGEKGRPQDGVYTREQRSSVNQLADRFQKDPYFKKAEAAQGSLDIIRKGIEQNNSAGDIAAVNQFQSGMVDPGATVREGDVALIQRSASLISRVQNYIPQLMKGGVLPPELRKEIRDMSEQIYQMRAKNANEITVKRFKGIAPKFGVNFDDIGREFPSIEQLRNPSLIGGPEQGFGRQSDGGGLKLPSGKTYSVE